MQVVTMKHGGDVIHNMGFVETKLLKQILNGGPQH